VRLFQANCVYAAISLRVLVRLWDIETGKLHSNLGDNKMRKTILFTGLLTLFGVIALITACGSGSNNPATGKTIISGPAGNHLTATISNADGTLRKGPQEFTLAFTDASGKPVDVGAVAFNNHMAAMGSMAAMNHAATLTTTGTPGVYRGKVDIDMAGDWQAQITYEAAAGKGSFSLPIIAK
jgi:hypothetical protein